MRPFVPRPSNQTVSIPLAAELLGISRAGCYRIAQDGRLPARRIGGRLVVRKDVLEGLLGGPLPSWVVTDSPERELEAAHV